ncbi:MAG: MYG1 family protein [Candidatus Paceibacterota bacterium]
MTTIKNKNIIKKLITHNGSFHSDDVFACATLCLILEKNGEQYEIIRTRDEEIIKNGDYVFDVGGVYDKDENRFDHHQKGGAGSRSFGDVEIEYAACGLVWKKFGIELCGDQKVVDLIDKKLIVAIDAGDNGFDLVENKYEISPYLLQHVMLSMRPTWREENLSEDVMFLKSVEIAKMILSREIIQAQDAILTEELVIASYNNAPDKKIIVLDKNYPYEYTLNNFPEPLFVIHYKESSKHWMVRAMREDPKTFKNRKDFPKSWAGLRGEELEKITGVSDAVFCHRALFLSVSKSKEGAIKLAQIAVES